MKEDTRGGRRATRITFLVQIKKKKKKWNYLRNKYNIQCSISIQIFTSLSLVVGTPNISTAIPSDMSTTSSTGSTTALVGASELGKEFTQSE